MAMMISKFHKLIQSRLLWGAFLVVIVFSFVIWGMVWPSQLSKHDRLNAAGTLDNEPVPQGEYRSAYLSSYLARALAHGREVPSTAENDALLRRQSWQRLATLREARKLGIAATDQELIQALRSNFAETNGAYNPQRYQAFLQNLVRPLGFTAAQFEQHVREEIAIQKMGSLVGRQAHVTPLEIRQTFETLLDKFTVEYALVRAANVEKEVSVAEADARQLYEADPQAFTTPEQREVSYAAYPIADYVEDTNEIAADAIQDYYELHIEDYTTKETDTNGQPREVVAELDQVKDGIVAALRREAAVDKADAAASELAFKAIPDRDGTVPDFAAEAAKTGRAAVKLPPFARYDLPLADGGMAFTATVFELGLDAFDRVSAPIVGQTNLYVAYLEKILEPRVPSFEEAKDRVMAAAKRKAVAEALTAKGAAVKEAAAAGLAAGKTLEEAVAETGATVSVAPAFTGLSGSSSSNAVVQTLAQAVVGFNQGEIADPAPYEDGVLVAYVKTRTPADPASFDSYRDEIASAIRNRRAQTLFRDWQASLLAPGRFTDLQPVAAADGQDEGDEGDVEEETPATNDDAAAADAELL